MSGKSGSGNDTDDEDEAKLWQPTGTSDEQEGAGIERHLKGMAKDYAEALEWKTDGPLEVHCDFISTVDQVLKLAGSTGNPAGLILVDPGRPMENVPGATFMGPDLGLALAAGEVRESFGALPKDHFAVAVIGCSEEDLRMRAEGLLATCKAVGMKTRATNRPPRLVALHISVSSNLRGDKMLQHAQRCLDELPAGQDLATLAYMGRGRRPAAD